MIRGILSGAAFGVVTVGVGLSVASLLAPQPAGNRPPLAPQVEAPSEASGDNREGTTPDLAAEGSEAGLATTETPLVTAPEDAPDAVLADTESAALPETGLPEADLTAPDDPAADDLPAMAAATEAPVLPNPQSVAPQVPVPEDDLSLATDPATPTPVEAVVPEPAVEAEVVPGLEPEVVPDAVLETVPTEEPATEIVVELPEDPAEEPEATTELDTPAEAAVAEAAPEAPATLPAETEAPPPSDVAVVAVEELPEPVVEMGAAPVEESVATEAEETAEDPVAVPEPEAAPVSEPVTEPVTEPAADAEEPAPVASDVAVAALEAVPEAGEPEATEPAPAGVAAPEPVEPALPAVNARESDATALPETDSAVRINRPGAEEAAVPEVPLTDDPATEINLIPEPQGPALERFAADFENPEAKPMMSVILIDDGSLAGASIALGSLPFPVTVALDPAATGAADRMANYRAAGIEVMAIARLPQGARPADVMVTFESVFATLPEVIGVLDAGEGGLQANSAVADQAMMRFAADGRGVVTMDEGLNMASRAAEAAGVPAGVIYRDLDGEGQDAQVIRRFLDQAAFRARQDSGVILLGRVRADTLSALNLWGGQNRAGQVALAPVSAVLLAGE